MADSAIYQKTSARKPPPARPRTGQSVACDECNQLHYRRKGQLIRKIAPKRSHPTAGKWLCSKECRAAVELRTHVSAPCHQCGRMVTRRRSQTKKSTFCSKECTNAFGLHRVKCCWPECKETMACRTILQSKRGRQYLVHRTLLTRKGDYARNTLCERHIGVLQKYLGVTTRLTPRRTKILSDPDAEYSSRGASGKFLRAFLFDRSGSRCQKCEIPLEFSAPPKTWQIDHIVPIMRGGRTKLANLQVLCASCHDEKSVGEKSEAGRNRHSATKAHRWLTHHQKDILIDRLRARLSALGEPID